MTNWDKGRSETKSTVKSLAKRFSTREAVRPNQQVPLKIMTIADINRKITDKGVETNQTPLFALAFLIQCFCF